MPELHLLLCSDRPAVRAFFAGLADCTPHGFGTSAVPVTGEGLTGHWDLVASATLAVVDMAPDAAAAVRVCRALHAQRPRLPIIALVCCHAATTDRHLQALGAAGVGNLLDLQATGEEVVRALQRVAAGGAVIHLQPSHQRAAVLLGLPYTGRDEHPPGPPHLLPEEDRRLLGLVACGLTDRTIGAALHMSPRTVHRHIQRLYHDLGLRNRTELAAWAGEHGFYRQAQPAEEAPGVAQRAAG